MSHPIRLRPELLDDAADAYAWYEERVEGLGDEFLKAFYAAIARIQRQPAFFRVVHFDFWRILLRRFPYFLD